MIINRNIGRLMQFTKIYEDRLKEAHESGFYDWPASDIPRVFASMSEALRVGAFKHEGPAMKATCMKLNIPCTRKAINNFLDGR